MLQTILNWGWKIINDGIKLITKIIIKGATIINYILENIGTTLATIFITVLTVVAFMVIRKKSKKISFWDKWIK